MFVTLAVATRNIAVIDQARRFARWSTESDVLTTEVWSRSW